MAYKALKSFVGAIKMRKGEERDIEDSVLASKLVSGGFIVEVGGDKPKSSKSSDKPARKNKGGEANG